MRTRIGRICPPYSDARQRRILKWGFDSCAYCSVDLIAVKGLRPKVPTAWKRCPVSRNDLKKGAWMGTLICLWRGSPTIGPTYFFSPPAQLCAVTCVNNWNIVVCDVRIMQLIGIFESPKCDVNPQPNTRGIGPLVGRTSGNRRSGMHVLVEILSITYNFSFICKYIFIWLISSGREIFPLLKYPGKFLIFEWTTKIWAQVRDRHL